MDTGNRTWIGVVAALAAVVVVVLGWLTFNSSDSNAETTSGEPEEVAGDTTGERRNDCPEQPVSDVIPTEPPPARWESLNRNLLPYSEEHGPAVIEGDIARCYSRTPEGALIAAIQTTGRLGYVEDTFGVFTASIEPSDAAASAREEMGEHDTTFPLDGGVSQRLGFRFVDYREDQAMFELATRKTDDGTLFASTYRMVWHEGDWKVVVNADSEVYSGVRRIADLDGFVEWGGA